MTHRDDARTRLGSNTTPSWLVPAARLVQRIQLEIEGLVIGRDTSIAYFHTPIYQNSSDGPNNETLILERVVGPGATLAGWQETGRVGRVPKGSQPVEKVGIGPDLLMSAVREAGA